MGQNRLLKGDVHFIVFTMAVSMILWLSKVMFQENNLQQDLKIKQNLKHQ